MSKKINEYIEQFLESKTRREIYNEFSFQHELGIYLRNILEKEGYKVEFERNVEFFSINKSETCKKEIDIVIYGDDKNDKYAIELKYHPIGSGYKNRMKDSVKDIWFMEQLLEKGFETYVCVIAEDDVYFSNKKSHDKIYKYFRDGDNNPVNGQIDITKSADNNKKTAIIKGSYKIKWKNLDAVNSEDTCRQYYVIKINTTNN